jgi:hypothetical protein
MLVLGCSCRQALSTSSLLLLAAQQLKRGGSSTSHSSHNSSTIMQLGLTAQQQRQQRLALQQQLLLPAQGCIQEPLTTGNLSSICLWVVVCRTRPMLLDCMACLPHTWETQQEQQQE